MQVLILIGVLSSSSKHTETDSRMFGGLVAPSQEVLTYANKIEDQFIAYFSLLNKTVGIWNDILQCLKKIELHVPCQEFDQEYLLKLFVRMRIYYSLKFANRNLASCKRKKWKFVKVAHLWDQSGLNLTGTFSVNFHFVFEFIDLKLAFSVFAIWSTL